MAERFPLPEKKKIREEAEAKEAEAESERTPKEWHEKLRKLIEGMPG